MDEEVYGEGSSGHRRSELSDQCYEKTPGKEPILVGGALLVLALISCGGGEGLSSAVSALEGESERDLSLESSHCSTDVANLDKPSCGPGMWQLLLKGDPILPWDLPSCHGLFRGSWVDLMLCNAPALTFPL